MRVTPQVPADRGGHITLQSASSEQAEEAMNGVERTQNVGGLGGGCVDEDLTAWRVEATLKMFPAQCTRSQKIG